MACFVVLLIFLAGWPVAALGASAADLVRRGNQAFAAGRLDEALAAYDEASAEMPESARISFNRAAVYYRKEDYAKAADLFARASAASRDLALEAASRYNLGNCAFQQARQGDGDPTKALEALQRSVTHYQEALELAPELTEAAENIEVARLRMKAILDEIKRQQEAAARQQAARQQVTEKLDDLIDRQQALAERTQRAAGDTEGAQGAGLADNQRDLQNETERLIDELPDPTAPDPASTNAGRRHLAAAADSQKRAADTLEKDRPDQARPHQAEALEALRTARQTLEGDPAGGQPEFGQNRPEGDDASTDGAPGEGQARQAPADPQDGGQGDAQPDDPAEQAVIQLPDDARAILNEEKENRRRRRGPATGGISGVDRNW